MSGLTEQEAPAVEPGRRLVPGYRVVRHLRRARPFDVYEVWSEERRCSSVVKTPRPAALGDARVAAQLREEALRLLAFSHPHLVRAYEFVQVPRPSLVLETLEGQTLQHLVQEAGGPLAVAELACLGLHLCSAIGYLHGKRLLHLDLKPSNIVSDAGRAKLIDLSVARPPGPGMPGDGTPTYMSPEQAAGGELTPAADVWGLGAVLYECVTGQVPFARSRPGSYVQLSHRLALPRGLRGGLPVELADLIDACLSPAAEDRPHPGDIEALLDRLAS